MRSHSLRLLGILCSASLLSLAACSVSSSDDASAPSMENGGYSGGAGTSSHADAGSVSKGGSAGAYQGAAGAAGSGEYQGMGGRCWDVLVRGRKRGCRCPSGGRGTRARPRPPSRPAKDAADMCATLDQSKPLVLYQSADDSNSMASPVIARALINSGRIRSGVADSPLRVPELLSNRFRSRAPRPGPGGPADASGARPTASMTCRLAFSRSWLSVSRDAR